MAEFPIHPKCRSGPSLFWRTMVVVIALRLGVGVVLFCLERAMPTPPYPDSRLYLGVPPQLSTLGQLFVKWDSYWYLNIVEYGYQPPTAEIPLSNLAFAPLYPLAIQVLSQLGIEPWVGGVLVSLLCFLASLCLVYQLGVTLHSAKLGSLMMIFLSVFPSAWSLHMVYSESMFCMLLAAFFMFYLRGRYGLAGLCGALLPFVRIAGLAVLPAVLADVGYTWWKERRLSPAWRSGALTLAGLVGVGLFYLAETGDPLAFAGAGRTWFGELGVAGHTSPLLASFAMELGKSPDASLSVLFMVVYGVASLALLKSEKNICGWFAVFYMVMLFKTPLASAQMRYLLPLFPVHAYLIKRLMGDRLLLVVIAVLLCLQVVLAHLNLTWKIIM